MLRCCVCCVVWALDWTIWSCGAVELWTVEGAARSQNKREKKRAIKNIIAR
jgi:hypothetical protein